MKTCPKCGTENPSKATLCMKCGTMLVAEEELTVEEKLQRELSKAQDEIVLLKSALDTALKSNSADLNKDLEKERDALKKKNEQLSVLVVEMANKTKGLEERLKSVGNELSSSKSSIQKLQERIKELLDENNVKKKHSKWKVLSIVLIILLSVCGVCFLWYALGNRNTYQYVPPENSEPVIDSLRLANEQLQVSRDSLLVVIQGSDSVQVESLARLKALQEKCDSLKDVNDKLNSIRTTYEGHDAEYWYVQYRKENSCRMYSGHDAKYWYEQYQNQKKNTSSMYNGHDAKYWYEQYQKGNSSSIYNGHDAKYWYDNRLYGGHDAKYWYNDRLYGGHDAEYWYNNRLYEKHDAKYWYEKYMGMLNPNK